MKRWWTGLIPILLLIAFLIVWNNGLRDQVIPRNFGMVEAGRIYRSGQISAFLVEPALAQNGIRRIVCLSAAGAKPADVEAEIRAAAVLGIDRQVFPLSGDGTGRLDVYADAVAAIDHSVKAHQPVLVHCVAGAQRTGGVLAVYQILVEHKTPADAVAEMEKFGHDPRDNPHLLPYLNDHMTELARLLVDRGAISAVPGTPPMVSAR